MTQIPSSLTNPGRSNLVAILKDNAAGVSDDGTEDAANTNKPDGFATVVDLSEEAQAILLLESDQAVADKLEELVKSRSHSNSNAATNAAEKLFSPTESSVSKSDPLGRVEVLKAAAADSFEGHDFDALIEQARLGQQEGTYGMVYALPDENENAVQQVLFSLAQDFANFERHGKTEEAQKLYAAVTGGTLQIENPDQMENLQLSYEATITQNEFGRSIEWNLDVSATGAVKTALESDLAMTHGYGEDGIFYIDWSGADESAEPIT